MKEKDFQSKFSKWLRYNWTNQCSARFELKLVNLSQTKTFNLKLLKDHQIQALSTKKLIYKIPDTGFQNPFDCLVMSQDAEGYLVIQFWKCAVKHFYMIPIANIIKIKEEGTKSLNEAMCKHLGFTCSFK